jgi:methionyl aminopeptidase
MDDWEKAGKIAAECLGLGKKLIKVDNSLLNVVEAIEKKIYDSGAKTAFPVNISINEIAAHDTPRVDDERVFKEGDLVKLDVGVCFNGAIGDAAVSIDLGNNKKLIQASEEALNEAIKVIKAGIKLNEVGKAIETKIKSFGFNPIKNLSGHGLGRYKVHTGFNIPNYDNKDLMEIEEGMYIAIEPFATKGGGRVEEGKGSGIYRIEMVKPTRNIFARNLLKFLNEEYKTLPFTKRWLKDRKGVDFALNNLEKEGILYQYPLLIESSKGIVSQSEHSLLVKKDGSKILTI